MQKNEHLYFDFPEMIQSVYEPAGLCVSQLFPEAESQEYAACRFSINDKSVVFRAAKITPTKIGQFVTLWKRIGRGPIMPFDMADDVAFFVVNVRQEEWVGQFIFSKAALLKHGVISKDGMGGKRAMRVYPRWDQPDSPQAQKTQAWQLQYFFEINLQCPRLDSDRIRRLFLL